MSRQRTISRRPSKEVKGSKMQRKVILGGVALAALLLMTRLISGFDSSAARPPLPAPAVIAQAAQPAAVSNAIATATRSPATTHEATAQLQPPSTTPLPVLRSSAPASSNLVAPLTAQNNQPRVASGQSSEKVNAAEQNAAAQSAAAQPASVPTPRAIAMVGSGMLPAVASAPTLNTPLNGVAVEAVLVLPDNVRANIREVYARGQHIGRNPRAFSKIGDSTMVWPAFMSAFDWGYNLGPYSYLQTAIGQYAGSFSRNSVAAVKGINSWRQFDPASADLQYCRSNEGPVQCEFRLNNPSIALIRLGANDWGEPGRFQQSMERIVEYFLNQGVIPVLGTKPDRLEGPDNTLNKIVGQIAAEYEIPLWDYDQVAATVPNRGLLPDKVHFQDGGPHNYSLPGTFQHGDSLEDLTALMMLDALDRIITEK
jgi:hypothetical protein